MKKFLFILVLAAIAGCSNGLEVASKNSVANKEINPMLKEIYSTASYIKPGVVNDVKGVVERYIPLGSSREDILKTLERFNMGYSVKNNSIYSGVKGGNVLPMPNPIVSIEFQLDGSNFLEKISAIYFFQQ